MVLETKELTINMGPQHPATHGVLRLILGLDGEVVLHSDPQIGYLHRGIEKIAENKTYQQFTPYTDRLDYVASISNNFAYCLAVEKLLGLEVPPRADYLRVIMAELTRISSHLVWLGTHAVDIGAITVLLYCFRERESIMDLFEISAGARLTANYIRIGGVMRDINDAFCEKLEEFIKVFPSKIKDYEALLTKNRIWLKRTKGIAKISAEDGIALGLSGPSLRGSGVAWDVRKQEPYSVYPKMDFIIPTGENGDVYDRYLVRMEELRQSTRIIEQALALLPEGEIMGKVPRVLKPAAGEVYTCVEAPKGELGFYIISDGSDKPKRLKIRAPSFVNLEALPTMIEGGLIADVVAAIGSIDIVLGEIDR